LKEAAIRVGFPNYQTLRDIELGKREIKASELSRFAKTYFRSISTLLGEERPVQVPELVWRSQPKDKIRRKELESQIFFLAEQFSALEKLLNRETEPFSFFGVAIEEIRTNMDIYRLADKVSKLLDLGKRPAFSLQSILEQEFGIRVFYYDLSEDGSAASMISENHGAVIVINSNEAPWRRNFDLAHELFHLITWRIASPEELKDKHFFEQIEKKADAFASALLLPEPEVRKEFDKKLKAQDKISYADLVDIAREFGVSSQAMIYRLANIRYITWVEARRIAQDETIQEISRNVRSKEWGETPVCERLHSLAIQCLRKGLVSRGKFANLVGIDRVDIDDFILMHGQTEIEGDSIEIMASGC